MADVRVDWFRLITNLQRHGYTLSDIAAALGMARTTVHGWKSGAFPRYDDGDRLISLWSQVSGECRETVPRVDKYSYRA